MCHAVEVLMHSLASTLPLAKADGSWLAGYPDTICKQNSLLTYLAKVERPKYISGHGLILHGNIFDLQQLTITKTWPS
jgi:hypothetical protein